MRRVFASSDWHGNGELAKKVLEWLKPEDVLYFLGDAMDRGPDGIKIFDELINRPNTYYICGNHEDMMASGITYLTTMNNISYCESYKRFIHWMQNGGGMTTPSLEKIPVEAMLEYRNRIRQMPEELIYQSPAGHTVIMEHAGYTPFNYNPKKHDPLWDRSHFNDAWNGSEDLFLVHGHTPVHFLKYEYGYKSMPKTTKEEMKLKQQWSKSVITNENFDWQPSIIRYCDGHKFNIDMGTAFSNRIALLDLDTFEEFYFDKD